MDNHDNTDIKYIGEESDDHVTIKPIDTINDHRLPGIVSNLILDKNWKPTDVQRYCWGAFFSGVTRKSNIMALSPTGTGKTLAYGVPMISTASHNSLGLVLVPTHELCRQVCDVLSVTKEVEIKAVYGGAPRGDQLVSLKALFNIDGSTKPGVIVATPGRLLDLMRASRSVRKLIGLTVLVAIDECDKMMSMGFREQLQDIRDALSIPNVMLLSATMSDSLKTFAESWLKGHGPAFCITSSSNRYITNGELQGELLSIAQGIDINVSVCSTHKKPRKLLRLLLAEQRISSGRCIESKDRLVVVFFNKIKTLSFIRNFLQKNALKCLVLHGQLRQEERESNLTKFKTSPRFSILLATDVVGRGIDIPNVDCVIQYDFPGQLSTFCHRVGRSGRSDTRKGKAYAFITRNLSAIVPNLIELLEKAGSKIDPLLSDLVKNDKKADAVDYENRAELPAIKRIAESEKLDTYMEFEDKGLSLNSDDDLENDSDFTSLKSRRLPVTATLPAKKRPRHDIFTRRRGLRMVDHSEHSAPISPGSDNNLSDPASSTYQASLLKQVVNGVRASSHLPKGYDFKFFAGGGGIQRDAERAENDNLKSNSLTFLNRMKIIQKRLLSHLDLLIQREIPSSLRISNQSSAIDDDDRMDIVSAASDAVLEKADAVLDQIETSSSTDGSSFAAAATAKAAATFSARETMKRRVTQEHASSNIRRPQLSFIDVIDNSRSKCFVPKIKSKPHALQPLKLELDGNPDRDEDSVEVSA
eukprot:UC4_evm1s73